MTSQRDDYERRLFIALHYAHEDMEMVLSIVGHLMTLEYTREHDAIHVRRAIETGVVVTYARQFTRTKGLIRQELSPSITDRLLLEAHAELLERRHTFDAHTDDSGFRGLIAAGADDVTIAPQLYTSWSPPPAHLLNAMIELALAQRDYLARRIREWRERNGTPTSQR